MPDMKKFLEVNSVFGKSLLIMLTIASASFTVLMLVFMIGNGFPLLMAPIPTFPFLLMLAFCVWQLRKSIVSFPKWWNSLTDAQRADMEEDYRNAEQLNNFLILGKRYAFIRQIGQPLPYAQIQEVYFLRTRKDRRNMYVVMNDGRKFFTTAPLFSSRESIIAELSQRCGRDLFAYDRPEFWM